MGFAATTDGALYVFGGKDSGGCKQGVKCCIFTISVE
jgi:hypothetical protein